MSDAASHMQIITTAKTKALELLAAELESMDRPTVEKIKAVVNEHLTISRELEYAAQKGMI